MHPEEGNEAGDKLFYSILSYPILFYSKGRVGFKHWFSILLPPIRWSAENLGSAVYCSGGFT